MEYRRERLSTYEQTVESLAGKVDYWKGEAEYWKAEHDHISREYSALVVKFIHDQGNTMWQMVKFLINPEVTIKLPQTPQQVQRALEFMGEKAFTTPEEKQ